MEDNGIAGIALHFLSNHSMKGAVLSDVCQVVSQFGLKSMVSFEANSRLVFSVDLLHIRHTIFFIRQTSDVPIGGMTLPLLHKDQIESFEIAIFVFVDTAFDFLRRTLGSQLLLIEISLVPICSDFFGEIDGANVENMRNFILFEERTVVLLLGVHVFMVKLVLSAVQQFECLCAAGVHLSLDGTAR